MKIRAPIADPHPAPAPAVPPDGRARLSWNAIVQVVLPDRFDKDCAAEMRL